jgi:1,4-alpha-glucan branching enzyme
LKHDPSSFLSTLSSFDCYLFRQGKHWQICDRHNACILGVNGISGIVFAISVRNAMCISVVGDFYNWNGRYCRMRMSETSRI